MAKCEKKKYRYRQVEVIISENVNMQKCPLKGAFLF
jgi:hypothetical protein